MMSFKSSLFAAGVLLVIAIIPAGAATVSGTFSGVINGLNTIDTYNWFNEGAGADLTGQTITGTYSYDTTTRNFNLSPSQDLLSFAPASGPNIILTSTIGATTLTTVGDFIHPNQVTDAPSGIDTAVGLSGDNGGTDMGFYVAATGPFVSGATIFAPFSIDRSATGKFVVSSTLGSQGESITFSAAIPEPASIGLILAGLVGLTWIRRRTAA